MSNNNIYTIGIDVGGSCIKAVLMQYCTSPKILISKTEKIRKRNPLILSEEVMNYLLEKFSLKYDDMAYVASTGEGEMVRRKTGHFYSMTTHSRGAQFFHKDCKTVVDMGALYVRAIKVSSEGRVMDYKMTGQCASGSGQFIENISRYLGLAIEEVGDVSLKSQVPETPSGICAVLAETDVINMVSRGISTPDIIKGIHLSIAGRVVKLLSSLKAESPIVLTGGMALNKGMVQAITELAKDSKYDWEMFTDPNASYAGAIGAALWGGYRYNKLKEKDNNFVFQKQ
ncbi:MAG: benzoyl-CoA reductase subunit D [Ignavibacteria bacterium]|nr:acyl-CoA dehydratase activase [Ignavibacteria bacterium]MCC7158084.1 benzoyl-CoA reductase subunit D [Ignavibacteria bacterium]